MNHHDHGQHDHDHHDQHLKSFFWIPFRLVIEQECYDDEMTTTPLRWCTKSLLQSI